MRTSTGTRVRLGIVGAGVMGARYARILQDLPHIEMVGVADVDKERAEKITQAFGGDAFEDYRALLERGLDGVIVATSDDAHVEPCLAAASLSLPVMLEKPMADNSANAKAILEAFEGRKAHLFVGHTLRFDPRYVEVARLACEGHLGKVVNLYARRWATVRSGRRIGGRVSVTVFQGVHDIDVLNWVTQSRVVEVSAQSVTHSLADIGVADSVVACLRFESGAVASLEQSWGLPQHVPFLLDAKLTVVGTSGMAEIDARGSGLSILSGEKWTQPDMAYNLPAPPVLRGEVEHFIGLVKGEIAIPRIKPEEAFAAVHVAEAVDRAAATGSIVRI